MTHSDPTAYVPRHTPPRVAFRFALSALALALTPALGAAQFGGAIGVRVPTGAESNARNSERSGYEARLTYDREMTASLGWRAELSYNQMQYQRDTDTLRFRVSENGFEIGASLRGELRQGAFTGVYGMAGPLASFRALCGSSGRFDQNGRVVCDEGETARIGYALGVGYRWQSSQTRDMSFEVRYLDHVTAAQGGSLLTVSIGIRARTRNAND
jgi:hypothetical protein